MNFFHTPSVNKKITRCYSAAAVKKVPGLAVPSAPKRAPRVYKPRDPRGNALQRDYKSLFQGERKRFTEEKKTLPLRHRQEPFLGRRLLLRSKLAALGQTISKLHW